MSGVLGFDIEAVRDGRPLLVEIKSQTPQTSARLRDPYKLPLRFLGLMTPLAPNGNPAVT
jgi:hypothetical protein